LARSGLGRFGPDEHVLVVVLHHMLYDGWSMDILWRELAELYTASARGVSVELPALPIQYVDYAAWEQAWIESGTLATQLAFWTQHLAGAPAEMPLPWRGPRPPRQTFDGASLERELPHAATDRLRALSREQGATMFMTLAAALRVVLARYSGLTDLVLGSPVVNRGQVEVEGAMGLFANTIALRNSVEPSDTFETLLAREKRIARAAFDHQQTPFELIVDALAIERDLSRSPLFQVLFNYVEDQQAAGPSWGGIRVETVEGATTANFDLTVTSARRDGQLVLTWTYNTDLFDARVVAQMADDLAALLERLPSAPARRLAELVAVGDEVRERLLVQWNGSPATLSEHATPAWFAEVARAHADRIALADAAHQLTYRELDGRARAAAAYLQSRGVRPEERVAVCMVRSADLIVALLGVMYAGCAYLPLDIENPAERLAYMLEDAAVRIVLVDDAGAAVMPHGVPLAEAVRTETPFVEPTIHVDQIAYVIYTSGTTGRPKGVAIAHRSLGNLVRWYHAAYGLTADDRSTLLAGLAFDATVYEIWPPLLAGAQLLIADDETRRDPRQLVDWLGRTQATNAFMATPLFEAVLADGSLPGAPLRVVTTAGDALHAIQRDSLPFRLLNAYGPTECTVCATVGEVALGDRPPTIGRGIGGARPYVLDRDLALVPPSVTGELYLGGEIVGRGYLGRPDLTAERFLPDPYGAPGARMYRTGDLVRWSLDGELEFMGRADHQVKIRGFRIELGEIEQVLSSQPGIEHAAVVARRGVLVAYIVGEPQGDLRAALAAKLPSYMVPAAFVRLAALPLTVNGKLDRKALPEPDETAYARGEYVEPSTPTERTLAAIWQQLLGIDRVGVNDDFFALGGHSMLTIRLVNEVVRVLGVRVPVRQLFEDATLGGLAKYVDAQSNADASLDARPVYVATTLTSARATSAQEYFWSLDRDDHDASSYLTVGANMLVGPLDTGVLADSFREVAGYHSIYRTAYREENGVTTQVVRDLRDVRPFELDVVDRSDVPEAGWRAAVEDAVKGLIERDYDLDEGHGLVSGRLVKLGADRHVFVRAMHHIACDGAGAGAFMGHVMQGYHRLRAGEATAMQDRPLQYIDVADARERWAQSPAGQASEQFWRDYMRDTEPVALEGDFPRAPIDARRDASPRGITADLSYAPISLVLPAEAYANAVAAAQARRTTPMVVFMTALAWLCRERSGQDQFASQFTYSPRAESDLLKAVNGCLTSWAPMRVDLAGAREFADAVVRTRNAVAYVQERGAPHDFYSIVPHWTRRVAFNYIPMTPPAGGSPAPAAPDQLVTRPYPWPFPVWKRVWDLHLTLIDSGSSAQLFWTGFSRLFRQETVRALLDRYIAILTELARP